MDEQLEYDYRILEETYMEKSRFYPQFTIKNDYPHHELSWNRISHDKTNSSFSDTYEEAYKTLKAYRDNYEKNRVRDRIIHPVTFL